MYFVYTSLLVPLFYISINALLGFNMSFFPGMEAIGSMDDLLDFSLDIGKEDDDEDKPTKSCPSLNSKCGNSSLFSPLVPDDPNHSYSVSLIFQLSYDLLLVSASVMQKEKQ